MKDCQNEPAIDLANQNETIVKWAKENFPKALNIQRFDFELLIIVLVSPLAGIGVLGMIDAFFTARKDSCTGLVFGIIVLALLAPLVLEMLRIRRRMVVYLDGDGVKTRGGKYYQWSNLYYVCFHSAAGKRSFSDAMEGKRWNKFRTELFFEDGGRVCIPAKSGFETIFEHIPCQKEDRRGKMW